MTRVAIIAALPGELKPLVRGWPHSVRNGVHFWAQRSKEEEWKRSGLPLAPAWARTPPPSLCRP